MSLFLESPWPALALGLAIVAVLVFVLIRTGKASVIALIAGVAALTGVLLLVERTVVTEREEIEDTLHAIAAILTTNDVPQVMAMISPACPRRNEAQAVLSRVVIREAKIGGDLQIQRDRQSDPPRAITEFTGRIAARDKQGAIPYENMIRRFKITLGREGDRWLIVDFADTDLRQ